MKKTVLNKPQDEIFCSLSDIGPDKFYGTLMKEETEKGFITKTEYSSRSVFTIRCGDAFTRGNGWDCCDSKTLEGCVNKILESGNKVFQFDTFNELMEWVIS
jgi:hypothetical protein